MLGRFQPLNQNIQKWPSFETPQNLPHLGTSPSPQPPPNKVPPKRRDPVFHQGA